ncbi:hypothetical protein BH10PSE10_BH10PSE10_25700 [soil metagenome]
MLDNVPLRDARPAVIVCPECARHLMEIADVRWAMTKLEFTYECSGCGAQTVRAIAGDTPVFVSRASKHLQSLAIFDFSPDAEKTPRHRPAETRYGFEVSGARRTG